jgi:HAD superfamily hydrolase (TIGR01509 family)
MAMVALNRIKALIFDLDGTLIDSEKHHLRAFAGAMREFAGYELTPADEAEFVGATSVWLSARLAERHGFALDPLALTARKFELLYRDFQAELFPGAERFVRAWAGRVPLAVASNSPRHFVELALAQTGLRGCFAVVTTVDDVQRRKPDPEMVQLTVKRLGVRAPAALVLEDTALGVEAARGAGCPVVLLDNGMLPAVGAVPPEVPVLTWQALLELNPAG